MIDRRERPSAIDRPEPDSAKTKSRRRVALLTDRAQAGAALVRASMDKEEERDTADLSMPPVWRRPRS